MCAENTSIFKKICCMYVDGRHAVEVQGASLMLLLGIWLWCNETFEVSAVYKIMAAIGTEKTWAIIFMIIATIQLLSLYFDKARFEWQFICIDSLWIRKHILLVKGAIWFTLFMGVIAGDARALSAPMYLVFAFNAFRAFFCIKYI
jgi:hypothetical protein